jgi:hypothetical protein
LLLNNKHIEHLLLAEQEVVIQNFQIKCLSIKISKSNAAERQAHTNNQASQQIRQMKYQVQLLRAGVGLWAVSDIPNWIQSSQLSVSSSFALVQYSCPSPVTRCLPRTFSVYLYRFDSETFRTILSCTECPRIFAFHVQPVGLYAELGYVLSSEKMTSFKNNNYYYYFVKVLPQLPE